MKIVNVVGARPNFVKLAPLYFEFLKHKEFNPITVHTGQHYDYFMSKAFLDDFNLPAPDYFLRVGPGSRAMQTARIIAGFEKLLLRERPDLTLVLGDVNSTLACSIAAANVRVPIAHVEAGLRSFDHTMPEELNRVVTDSLSDFLFTTCKDANENLKKEGIAEKKIYFVGNVMADTLFKFMKIAKHKAKIKLDKKDYAILTLHRASNVDDKDVFKGILLALEKVSAEISVIFPAHPRTKKQIKLFGYGKYFNFTALKSNGCFNLRNTINLLPPLSYLNFLNLMSGAKFVLTDSGGVQEETTMLGIPCLTIRKNTERPITIREGTNILVGTDRKRIVAESMRILNGKLKTGKTPKLWDGKTAQRIVKTLRDKLFRTNA